MNPFQSAGIWIVTVCLAGTAGVCAENLPPHGDPTAFDHPQIGAAYDRLPLSFEANRGQSDSQVEFIARGHGYTLFLNRTEAVFVLRKTPAKQINEREPKVDDSPSSELRLRLAHANPAAKVVGLDGLPGRINYFAGRDPAQWHSNIPTYARVRYEQVYPGVDLVYYGNQRQLEYDLVVAPGADPRNVTLEFEGADKAGLNPEGDLRLDTPAGEVLLHKPVVYQEIDGRKREVAGRYHVLGPETSGSPCTSQGQWAEDSRVPPRKWQVTFEIAAYDGSRPLVIDPVLSYATYLGGGSGDGGSGIAVDAAGNTYVVSLSDSYNFPKTFAVPDARGFPADRGTVITKLNADGSAVVYSAVLSGGTAGLGIAADAGGHAYVTGFTYVDYFPTTTNAWQSNFGGGAGDAFVVKLGPQGTNLVYSTFLGGSGADIGKSIAVDAAGNAYVTGFTRSTNFPTQQPLQTTNHGFFDIFVTKLNPDGSKLLYSTYLGGSLDEFAGGIAVDIAGNAYISGQTGSTNFPVANAYQGTNGGAFDAFVAKLDPSGSALLYSTYLGGSADDSASGIAVDAAGNAYLAGQTASTNFPVANAYQGSNAGFLDAFVTKLNASGSALLYSTYLGGSLDENPDRIFIGYDEGYIGQLSTESGGIAVDALGNAFVTGSTTSPDFPTVNALKGTNVVSSTEVYVAKLSAGGSSLGYSTYLGGGGGRYEAGHAIAVDKAGNAFVTGATIATAFPPYFPTTPGAFQPEYRGGDSDGFVVKISETPPPVSNNNFADRIALAGTRLTALGSNVGASKEPGEANHAGDSGGRSVWWTWTAPANGKLTITTIESDFDTLLAIYTGSALPGLVEVASNDDDLNGNSASEVTLKVSANTPYQIAVDGKSGATGRVDLSLTLSVPPNDDLTNSVPIGTFPATVTGSNVDATLEPGENNHYSKSVWWSWVSPTNANVTISAVGSGFRTLLDVYTGSSVSSLTLVADLNTDTGGTNSQVTFKAIAGTPYYIAVDGVGGDSGNITLNLRLANSPPNDDFANRIVIRELPYSATLTNAEATIEPAEAALLATNGFNPGFSSIWWSWTAPTNGSVLMTTTGSSFDTRLTVYVGESLSNLNVVTNNDNYIEITRTSRVLFGAVSNTTYQIAVDSGYFYDAFGVVRLNVGFIAPPAFVPATIARSGNGQFQARLKGTIEQSYAIEASTNLTDWTSVFTNSAANGFFNFVDAGATNFGRRFYRAREAP